MAQVTTQKTEAEKAEEEKKQKDQQSFDNGVRVINNNFNNAYTQMNNVSKLIADAFVLNGITFDNDKINNLLRSIK